jgi:predicted Rossmann-fold nucleotide-binding protein
MFTENQFSSAVFIGGTGGVLEEFELLRKLQPQATPVPIISAGGAAKLLAEMMGSADQDLRTSRDFVALFHKHLNVSEKEERYTSPVDQPADIQKRYWSRSAARFAKTNL